VARFREIHIRDPAEQAPFRVLYAPKDSAIRPLVARLLIAQRVPLFGNRIKTASPVFARAVILADPDTVWVISKGVVADDITKGRLKALEIDVASTQGAIGIMSRAEEVPSVATRTFTKLLNRLCKDGPFGNG
jgi:LysR family pca operon transcriptional activator